MTRRLTLSAVALGALTLVAGCADGLVLPGLTPEPEPVVLPPAVAAALPPGAPPSVVFDDGRGCYLYSVEVTDPPSGYPLLDAAGNPICQGSPAVIAAAPAPAAI